LRTHAPVGPGGKRESEGGDDGSQVRLGAAVGEVSGKARLGQPEQPGEKAQRQLFDLERARRGRPDDELRVIERSEGVGDHPGLANAGAEEAKGARVGRMRGPFAQKLRDLGRQLREGHGLLERVTLAERGAQHAGRRPLQDGQPAQIGGERRGLAAHERPDVALGWLRHSYFHLAKKAAPRQAGRGLEICGD
jgi:hypothetical protein